MTKKKLRDFTEIHFMKLRDFTEIHFMDSHTNVGEDKTLCGMKHEEFWKRSDHAGTDTWDDVTCETCLLMRFVP